jgi:hypothetical protein
MYCPQCGQQQVSDLTRFCSRCGFPLEGVNAVLVSGGQLPLRTAVTGIKQQSPRSKGIRQGAMLMLSTILLVPLMAVITVNFDLKPELFVPLTAIFFFVGGLLRILYATIMEDANATTEANNFTGYAPGGMPQVGASGHNAVLPPASVNPATDWRRRPNTAELYQPPSITENTTRLLDKDEPKSR